jgi:hypothetical protein
MDIPASPSGRTPTLTKGGKEGSESVYHCTKYMYKQDLLIFQIPDVPAVICVYMDTRQTVTCNGRLRVLLVRSSDPCAGMWCMKTETFFGVGPRSG